MIFIQSLNTVPHFTEGNAYKQPSVSVSFPSEDEADFCNCLFECEDPEIVFYDAGGDTYKNDKTAFLYSLMSDTSTFVMYIKSPSGNEIDLSSEDLGEFFDKGFNTKQPLKFGYLVDWLKVFNFFNEHGVYSVLTEIDNYGVPFEVKPRKYNLYKFNAEIAVGTVKIETFNRGVILNGEDYRGMNWYKSQRIPAYFGVYSPAINKISATNSQRQPVQVEYTISESYTLETKFNTAANLVGIIRNDLLANEFYITDYNNVPFEKYVKIQLDPESIETGTELSRSSKRNFSFVFNSINPIIKRNLQ